ncbi:MAG: nuclear transport factor 2 family protein [Burkholderiaceae bacterium]|nr:nuclear transport factor 2 family protein [Burkholderiaceae bacterium]
MTDFDPYSPERIRDRLIIQDIMFKWCRAVDRLDLDSVAACFHEDAVDNHGAYKGGIAGLTAWIRERHKTIPFSMHQLSNMLIEFAAPDRALVETTVCSIQRYTAEGKKAMAQLSGGASGKEGMGADMTGSSRYIDRFECRKGQWKIARRTVVIGWRSIADVPADAPKAGPEWTVQSRNLMDTIFRERAEMGIR